MEGKNGGACFTTKPVRISNAIVFKGEEKPLNV